MYKTVQMIMLVDIRNGNLTIETAMEAHSKPGPCTEMPFLDKGQGKEESETVVIFILGE